VPQQLQCFSTLATTAGSGALCIAVTHDLNLALAHCTRLLVLQEGRNEGAPLIRQNLTFYAGSGGFVLGEWSVF